MIHVACKLATVLVALAAGLAAAQEGDIERTASDLITPATDAAVQRGLEWLAKQQHPDGSFGSGAYRSNVAVTGLAGMAFLGAGSTPGRGPYGEAVNRAVDYLLAKTQPSGFIVSPESESHGPMYGHGFALLFLAECYGMSPRAELRESIGRSVQLIVNTQNKEGGWRYYPRRQDADISVTICQVMALRAARNAGFHVPNETIDRTVEYVKKCQNPDGGFCYMLPGGESAFPRSAAGVVALYSAGIYAGDEIDKGLEYLMRFRPQKGVAQPGGYYFYAHYYAIQAMWVAGDAKWTGWYPAIRDELLARQRRDGAWPSPDVCVEYGTASACIILQVPNNVLPIFQR